VFCIQTCSWASEGFFPGAAKNIFPTGAESGETSLYRLETKKTTFFALQKENVKFQNPGEWQGPPLPSDVHKHAVFSMNQFGHLSWLLLKLVEIH